MIRHVDILLVEDSIDDAELTLRTLRKHAGALTVDHVRDGLEALEYLGIEGALPVAGSPRLILLDLKLPKIPGVDVLRSLRADERWNTVPVVVLTSSRENRDLDLCYRLGVNSYVVKPVDYDSFVDAVGRIGVYWTTINESAVPRT